MRSTQVLIAFVIVGLAVVATLYLALGNKSATAPVVTPEARRDSVVTQPKQTDALVPVGRVPAIEPQPSHATAIAPASSEPAPSAPTVLEDERSWLVEYANKKRAELIADEKRLTDEFKKDIDAEVEKRFQDGRYRAYSQNNLPTGLTSHGISIGRGDANTMKYVDIDFDLDAPLFVKQRKAAWLKLEIEKLSQ